MMDEAKLAGPKLRWFLFAAMAIAVVMVCAPLLLETAGRPMPKWTEYLAHIYLGLAFGFYVLLYPLPHFSPLLRRVMMVIFFGLSAAEFVQLLLKGL